MHVQICPSTEVEVNEVTLILGITPSISGYESLPQDIFEGMKSGLAIMINIAIGYILLREAHVASTSVELVATKFVMDDFAYCMTQSESSNALPVDPDRIRIHSVSWQNSLAISFDEPQMAVVVGETL